MAIRCLIATSVFLAVLSTVRAQLPVRVVTVANKIRSYRTTPWGDPDLQGTWTSDDARVVPIERPVQYGERAFLTEQELQAREKAVQKSHELIYTGGDAHSPALAQAQAKARGLKPALSKGPFGTGVDAAPVSPNWAEFARRASRQTSLVVNPSNGRIPALTTEAKARLAAKEATRRRPPESWEDFGLYFRCITRGVTGSILPVIYGNGLEIVQAPGYVAIRYEMVHETRIIPLDGRPHINPRIRAYMGDPIGHWDSDTLVIDTTNFTDRTTVGINGEVGPPHSESMHLVERFRRSSEDQIDYQVTIDDPKTYTAPWTIAFPITQEPGYRIFEYACHEGNRAMRNVLGAARADELKAGR
jgi:hypothetical protein